VSAALHDLSVAEAGRRLRAGTLTATALAEAALARIAACNAHLHPFILVTKERALADAARADAELSAGTDRGPFHGIPYALKDIYDTAGIATTCHSRLRLGHIPKADSVVAARFAAAGGVLLGKLATHEFAIGGPSFDLPFPPARNPWNPDHFTGGSSSGSGAAIAARIVRVASGSDTGGSIRGPAAYCGTVGLKPTYGRVSRRGVFPLSYTLDHCGPLARSVEDTAIAMQLMAGHDPEDPGSADVPVPDYRAGLEAGVRGLRIGVPRAFFATAPALTDEAGAAIDRTLSLLRDAGAEVADITLPDQALFAVANRVILLAEGFAIHEPDFRTRLLDYGRKTVERLIPGAAITSADLVQAGRVRRMLADDINRALGSHDALLTACSLAPAPRLDQPADPRAAYSPLQLGAFNLTGHPAMSVPVGLAAAGLPLSVQLVGRPFDEAMLLRIGRAIERLSGWEDVPFPAISGEG
jgi:aspartyl-tRNA(Asn)/glutamyl-tRNA(Gln) amidotransferase subunit A